MGPPERAHHHERVRGQDGACGNFNGNAMDDTTQAIKARIGARVTGSELLFHHPTAAGPAGPVKTIADCEQSKRTAAMKACAESNKGMTGHLLDDCIFDTCFGGDQYAAEDGMEAEERGERRAWQSNWHARRATTSALAFVFRRP